MTSTPKESGNSKALSSLTRRIHNLRWPLIGVVTSLLLSIPLIEARLSLALLCLTFLCLLTLGVSFFRCFRDLDRMKSEVTRLNQSQADLIRQKAKVQETYDELLDNQLALDLAARTKSEFLANMTHELRTPLNGIFGVVELLSRTPLTLDQAELLDTIRSCDDVLLALVNDVLDFSKIEAQQLILESRPFSVRLCVENAMRMVNPKILEKGIRINSHFAENVPSVVLGDLTRVEQILLNLLSNAVKFTEKGHVTISVERDAKSPNECILRIIVEDTGLGIPSEQIPKLFRKFSQVDASTSRQFGGTGLGLAICKGLAELMGGTIWVESEIGKGSRFIVLIKAVPAEGQVAINQQSKLGATARELENYPLSVLIVDDNPVNRNIAGRLLEMLGYKADLAADGLEAIERASHKDYDLIFMDLSMPRMDGQAATVEIRKQTQGRKQPYITALTANAIKLEQEKCLSSGMNSYLTKPVTLEQLADVIKECASLAGLKPTLLVPKQERAEGAGFVDETALAQLRAMSRPGERDFLTLLIDQYLSDSAKNVAELRTAWTKGDIAQLRSLAHKLRGGAKNLGATELSKLAADIEDKAERNSTDGMEFLLARFEKAYLDSKEILISWRRAAA